MKIAPSITLLDCSLIQSPCDVIVNQQKYSLAVNNVSITYPEATNLLSTNFSLNLQIKHLEDPAKIQEDLLEPIKFEDLIPQQQTHYILIFSIICIIFICSLSIAIYQWKKHSILKAIPIKTLQEFINEDVERTEGGGEISVNQL